MLRKNFLLFAISLLMIPGIGTAQKTAKKPSKIWYAPAKTETKEVKLDGQNIVSEKEITKFKLIVTNNTKDFLIVRPKECAFKAGNMTTIPNDKKKISIRPMDYESKVIDCTNTQNQSMHEYKFSFVGSGIYKTEAPQTTAMPEFKIPPSQNIIEEGDFKIELINSFIASDALWKVKLKITYNGTGAGIVEPRKISAKLFDDSIVANSNNEKIFDLERGEEENIVLYFASNRPINIVWNDAFKSASLVKLDPVVLNFEYDPNIK